MKDKNTKRVWLFDVDQPSNLESWLSKMAAKGWMLKEFKGIGALFEKQEPAEMEYRAVYFKDGIEKETRNRYEENGWEIIEYTQSLYILSAKTKDHPSEAYYTEVENEQWRKKDRCGRIINLLLPLMYLYLNLTDVISFKPGHVLNYASLNYEYVRVSAMLALAIMFLSIWTYNYAGKRYAKRVERMGREAHHGSKVSSPFIFISRMFIILGAVGIVLFMNHIDTQYGPVTDMNELELPFVEPEEIQTEPENSIKQEPVTKRKNTVFAEEYSSEWIRGEGEDYSYLDQTYYKKYSTSHMREFSYSVFYDLSYRENIKNVEELQVQDLDLVLYAPEYSYDGEYGMIAVKGNKVLLLHGDEKIDRDKLLEIVRKKLA